MHRNGSKCLVMGLFPRNSLLNQSQERSVAYPFPTCSRREILKTTFSNACESSKGLALRQCGILKKLDDKTDYLSSGLACPLSTRGS